MITKADIGEIVGRDVFGANDVKIGSAAHVFTDDRTGQPEFVSVRTGLFGMKESVVPLNGADFVGDGLRVPFDKDRVSHAPRIDSGHDLSQAEEDQLYQYYGASMGKGMADREDYGARARLQEQRLQERSGARDMAAERNASRPGTDDVMTRYEERLVTGVRREQVGRAKLHKHVVTEEEQVTVPVSHEEARVIREPITDAGRGTAMSGSAISEEEREVMLEADRPYVETEAVAVERVRLGKETVTDTQTVRGTVRKERIDFEDESARTKDGRRPGPDVR
jgi:uncharacterized protein (TIGR02271 family)